MESMSLQEIKEKFKKKEQKVLFFIFFLKKKNKKIYSYLILW